MPTDTREDGRAAISFARLSEEVDDYLDHHLIYTTMERAIIRNGERVGVMIVHVPGDKEADAILDEVAALLAERKKP